MGDDDLQIFATWFHQDRELADGASPAERYAARADLSQAERAAAGRIAAARLGLHRVLVVEPGCWLSLEDLVTGARARVRSPNVSSDAVRWDILLGRVMPGDPPSLWGPTRFFEPGDEPELLGELERLASAHGGGVDEPSLSAALRGHALELLRFTPARCSAEPSFFTLEGDPVAFASATWRVAHRYAVEARLRAVGGLRSDEPIEIDITAPRDALVADRPALPPVRHRARGGQHRRIRRRPPRHPSPSRGGAARRDDVGGTARASHRDCRARPRGPHRAGRPGGHVGGGGAGAAPIGVAGLVRRLIRDWVSVAERRLLGDFMTDRMRRWLDEPTRCSTVIRHARPWPASVTPKSSGWCAGSRTALSERLASASRPPR